MSSQNYKLEIIVVVQYVAKHYTITDSVECKYLRDFSISLNCVYPNFPPGWLMNLYEGLK
jgi:hypothetical protein